MITTNSSDTSINALTNRRLFTRAAALLLGISVVNFLASFFHWYSAIWWFDMPMHFAGGFFVSLLASWFYLFRVQRGKREINYKKVVTFAILSIVFVSIGWEIFELSVEKLFQIDLVTLMDSLSDIFYGFSGGLAALIYLFKRFLGK